ncbi:ATP-dependent Clp protease ATP-binding subunit, partial [Phormidium pseudopriestleyi FRX01]
MFEYFTEKSIKAIMLAQQEARRLGHNFVGTEQLLLGLIAEGTGIAAQVLKSEGVTLNKARVEVEKIIGRGSGFVPVEIPFTPRGKSILEMSLREASQLGQQYIATEHLLLALTQSREGVAFKILENLGVSLERVRAEVIKRVGENPAPASAVFGGERGRGPGSQKALQLSEFGVNLTEKAMEGNLDPVVGRKKEIERIIQILGRRTKNNPVLIGEPGVGKTALAEGLAQRIANQDVPETLKDKRVFTLDMGSILAGTRFRGDFEERIKMIMEEVRQAGNIILVIDEIHTLVGAGSVEGGMDAANLLKPALSRGEFQCIGATTLDEYRKHIERDAALERRFQPVIIGEPTIQETIEILQGIRVRYEEHHKLTISDEALVAAAKLSERYITDRFLPDKAIDLIDEAGSRVRLRNGKMPSALRQMKKQLTEVTLEKEAAVRAQEFEKASKLRDRELTLEEELDQRIKTEYAEVQNTKNLVVTGEDIAEIVAFWTSVPVSKLTESESEKLMLMEETLHQRLIGQEEAVKAVSRAIRRARVGLKNPNRPIASFIFSGPTG